MVAAEGYEDFQVALLDVSGYGFGVDGAAEAVVGGLVPVVVVDHAEDAADLFAGVAEFAELFKGVVGGGWLGLEPLQVVEG